MQLGMGLPRRRNGRLVVGVGSVALLAVLLAGCTTSEPTEIQPIDFHTEDDEPVAEVTPTPEAPKYVIEASASAELVNSDGYTFDVEWHVALPTGFHSDISNAAPGQTNYIAPAELSALVTNTTPGRNAKFTSPWMSVVALYDLASPICAALPKYPQTAVLPLYSFKSISGTGYCSLALATLITATSYDWKLEPGASASIVGTDRDVYAAGLPETPDLTASLNAPASVVLLFKVDIGGPFSWASVGKPGNLLAQPAGTCGPVAFGDVNAPGNQDKTYWATSVAEYPNLACA